MLQSAACLFTRLGGFAAQNGCKSPDVFLPAGSPKKGKHVYMRRMCLLGNSKLLSKKQPKKEF